MYSDMEALLKAILISREQMFEGVHSARDDELVCFSHKIREGEQIYVVTVKSAWEEGTQEIVVTVSDVLLFLANRT